MLNSAFDGVGASAGDYYPSALRKQIDELNKRIYDTLNNGVYRCGFATTQAAYEAAITPLFDTLDWLESILAKTRYLTGNSITEADWRLFTTLIRFDPVYVGHFKCNLRRIIDYPNLSNYLRDLYQQPGVAETVNMYHIKEHYYASHETINPSRVVPVGPDIDFTQVHNRAQF
jgi:putative glutathione S-transferase